MLGLAATAFPLPEPWHPANVAYGVLLLCGAVLPGGTAWHKMVRIMTATPKLWDEIFDASRMPRAHYAALWQRMSGLRPAELRALHDRMEAALREQGVTFSSLSPKESTISLKPWMCDLLPHLVLEEDWQRIHEGMRQRLRAFEYFLWDIYRRKEILRDGVIPFQPVLGSPHRFIGCEGIAPSGGHYLHLSGMCLTRDARGQLMVRSHHFSHAFGLSYMIQNRRVLARVAPELFADCSVASISQAPIQLLESLRSIADPALRDVMVVMLSPGTDSPVYSEHSFLARRMGVPLVQSGDLLVLEDRVFMKTISGLEQVDVIYSRVGDAWIDPLAYPDALHRGVPGLVHCLRKGTVQVVNSVGSQLADDRAILSFSHQIIRYYLGEHPILPTLTTYWLGDIDQREYVLENLQNFRVLPLTGERYFGGRKAFTLTEKEMQSLRGVIRKEPGQFVAQPIAAGARTTAFHNGRPVSRLQDHLVFALRCGAGFELVPGMLTRLTSDKHPHTTFEFGGGSKDSWVPGEEDEPVVLQSSPRLPRDLHPPERRVMSRVAESFYWMGRYLERSYQLAHILKVIETVETEELTASERKLYRPIWNRLLPPLDQVSPGTRRSIASPIDRYRLVLQSEMPGCLHYTLLRARDNARSIQDAISPEAWSVLTQMIGGFSRSRFREEVDEESARRVARRLSDGVVQLVPQWFGTAELTMLADDGFRFCRIGQFLERAIFTANAMNSISVSFLDQLIRPLSLEHTTEIELSAFLLLLGTRDAYRRVYQMRAEPFPVLQLLCQNLDAPRSVTFSLSACEDLLGRSLPPDLPTTRESLRAFRTLIDFLQTTDWGFYFEPGLDVPAASAEEPEMLPEEVISAKMNGLSERLGHLLHETQKLHHVLSDSFLNHQAQIANSDQPWLTGFA